MKNQWLPFLFLLATGNSFAQPKVKISLSMVSDQSGSELGLLIDVINLSNQDVAFYDPESLTRSLKFYRIGNAKSQHEELIHPYWVEFDRQNFLSDSIYKSTGALVHFMPPCYNWDSSLYREFLTIDSLYFEYQLRSSKYNDGIKEEELANFKKATGLKEYSSRFALVKSKEHFQEFLRVDFLREKKGNYRISLVLPQLQLSEPLYLAGTFRLLDEKEVYCSGMDYYVR